MYSLILTSKKGEARMATLCRHRLLVSVRESIIFGLWNNFFYLWSNSFQIVKKINYCCKYITVSGTGIKPSMPKAPKAILPPLLL